MFLGDPEMLYAVPRPDTDLDPDELPNRLADLAELVRKQREGERLSVDVVAERAAMSAVTWTKVERGQPVRGLTYAGIEIAFGWERGAINDYLTGGPSPVRSANDGRVLDENERLIMEAPFPMPLRERMLTRYRRRLDEAHQRLLVETEDDLRWAEEQQRNAG
jgi:hypothetical protein